MAFPTTSTVRDDFNRADEGPPPSASWETLIGGLKVISNQMGSSVNQNISVHKTSCGPDAEAWATVAVKGATNVYTGVGVRFVPGANTGYFGCFVTQSGTDIWEMYKIVAGVETKLGATVTGPEVTAGDKIGFEAIGTTLKLYHYTAGVWTEVMSRTDATHTGAGYTAAYIDATSGRLDDFGGGTVVVAGSSSVPQRATRRTDHLLVR